MVYLGSFSKTFAPGLRVGWVLAPHAVQEKLVLAAESATLCPPTFTQAVVSRCRLGRPAAPAVVLLPDPGTDPGVGRLATVLERELDLVSTFGTAAPRSGTGPQSPSPDTA